MSKWTKGPWYWGSYENAPDNIEDDSGLFNVDLYGNDKENPCIIENATFRPHEKANARLIAASPDLYEALDEVMQWIKNWDPNFSEDDEWFYETRPKVEAALAKAKGE